MLCHLPTMHSNSAESGALFDIVNVSEGCCFSDQPDAALADLTGASHPPRIRKEKKSLISTFDDCEISSGRSSCMKLCLLICGLVLFKCHVGLKWLLVEPITKENHQMREIMQIRNSLALFSPCCEDVNASSICELNTEQA